MSRVDDDRLERRADEARIAERRLQERQKKERTGESTAFDRAMSERAAAEKPFAKKLEPTDKPTRDLKAEQRGAKDAAKPAQDSGSAHEGSRVEDGLLEQGTQDAGQSDRSQAQRQADRRGQMPKPGRPSTAKTPLAASRADARSAGEAKEARSADAKGEDIAKETAGLGKGKKGGPVQRASDEDAGQGGKGGSGTKDQGPATFRLPPAALMAPPPLASPRDPAIARMTSITKEIVDKIVSRVLVGTNEKGVPEFRLELKSSVLKGLSIKVSGGRGGRIKAVFSGSDKEVLAALKKTSSDLVDALASRGLTLEDIVFEDAGTR